MDKRYMTLSDILGMKRAAREGLYLPLGKRYPFRKAKDYSPTASFRSLDELLEIDQQREKDGFPKRIKIGQVMPGPGKVIMVPYIDDPKLMHGEFEPSESEESESQEGDGDIGEQAGSGQGKVGDVIGETPLPGQGEGDGSAPRPGRGSGDHGIEAEAYKLGRDLSEKFNLPNLRDKGKKVPTDKYTYDLTDRHVGSGQILDKKETLKSIVKTNTVLGRLDPGNIDLTKFIVGPKDKVYRVLSREKVWESQAIVFFLRDYSGSMMGDPTKAIVTQHLMIYAWLLVQYEKLVIPRFFVHDTEAEEVTAKDYFERSAGGGTLIPEGYKEINKTVDGEALAKDYNIFLFQGTDGDDFDDGTLAIPEIRKILGYVNRMGVTVVRSPYGGDGETNFEQYIKKGNFLSQRDLFRMYVMPSGGVTEEKNVAAIKALIAQD